MLLYLALSTYAPLFWDGWLGEHRLLAAISCRWGADCRRLLRARARDLCVHRTMHNTPILWRWFPPMHHSAERVDIWWRARTSTRRHIRLHLRRILIWCSPRHRRRGGDVINLAATFMACSSQPISHAALGGYLVSAREPLRAHERGVTRANYGDLPLFDCCSGRSTTRGIHRPGRFYERRFAESRPNADRQGHLVGPGIHRGRQTFHSLGSIA